MMAIPDGLNLAYLIGLLCLSVGSFLHLIGLASVQWSLKDGNPILYYGLWDMCTGEVCKEHAEDFETGSMKVCQAFAIIGIVIGGFTLILGIVFAVMSMLKKSPRKIVPLVAMICGAASFVAINICVVTWAGGMPMRNEVKNGYSLVVSILGSLLIAFGGVLLFLGSR